MTGTGVALARRAQQQEDYPAKCSIAPAEDIMRKAESRVNTCACPCFGTCCCMANDGHQIIMENAEHEGHRVLSSHH